MDSWGVLMPNGVPGVTVTVTGLARPCTSTWDAVILVVQPRVQLSLTGGSPVVIFSLLRCYWHHCLRRISVVGADGEASACFTRQPTGWLPHCCVDSRVHLVLWPTHYLCSAGPTGGVLQHDGGWERSGLRPVLAPFPWGLPPGVGPFRL